MTHKLFRYHARRVALLIGALAIAYVLLVFSSAPPAAHANIYCWGKVLTNYQYCYGVARKLKGDRGYGTEKSVCVGADSIFGKCSAGPNYIAEFVYYENQEIYAEPWIEDNAAGKTTVYAETFL